MTYDLLDCMICVLAGIDPHCVCSQASVPSVPLALGSGLVLEGCWQRRQCPAGYKGVGWGWSIWGFPYDPLLTPMLLHRSHLSPACLLALQHSSGRRRCLCLLALVPSHSLLPRHGAARKSRQFHLHSAGPLPCTDPRMARIYA